MDRDTSDPNATLTSGMTTTPTEDAIADQFISITSSTRDQAVLYLKFAKGDLQRAIENFYVDDDSEGESSNVLSPPPTRATSLPASGGLNYEQDGDGASSHL